MGLRLHRGEACYKPSGAAGTILVNDLASCGPFGIGRHVYGAEYDQQMGEGTLIITIPPELLRDTNSWIEEEQLAFSVTADRSVDADAHDSNQNGESNDVPVIEPRLTSCLNQVNQTNG
jgi:hypothetical protein